MTQSHEGEVSRLFRLPEYGRAEKQFINSALHALTVANHPLLQQIPFSREETVPIHRVSPSSGVAIEMAPVNVTMDLALTISDMVDGNFDSLYEALHGAGAKAGGQLVGSLLADIGRVSEAAGTTVDAAGRPLSHELILEMLERVEIEFDASGQPIYPTIVVPPRVAQRIRELPSPTPEQDRAFRELMERKRREWDARRAHRRLS